MEIGRGLGMASESFKLAMKEINSRHEKALEEAQSRNETVSQKFPRIRQLNQLLSQTGGSIAKAVFAGENSGGLTIETVMRAAIAAQQEKREILKTNGYPEDYLETHFTCPLCEDTGYVHGKKCSCLRDLTAKYNAEVFNQSSHIVPSTFETFSLRYYSDDSAPGGKSPRQMMAAVLSFCRAYADTFGPASPSVLMMGETGLGKTHLSLSIAGEIMAKGDSVLYASAPDLFRKLQNEYYGKGESGVDTMETLMEARLTIIDDLGAEMENQFNVSALYNIVNSRLNAGRPVIISTNLTPKELERRYTNRVASRLMTMYQCLRFVGRDVRQIKLRNNEF